MSCAEAGWTGATCTSGSVNCQWCKRSFCDYHTPPNCGGKVGGHSNCSGKKCEVLVGGATCGGAMSECNYCEHYFCSNHIKFGGVSINIHLCDNGCQTTAAFKKNCVGKKKELIECKHCKNSFCKYHALPVEHLGELTGGHVCKNYTSGAMMIGDSVEDYFNLAVKCMQGPGAIAAHAQGRAIAIFVDQFLRQTGLLEVVDWFKEMKKKLPKDGPSAAKRARTMATDAGNQALDDVQKKGLKDLQAILKSKGITGPVKDLVDKLDKYLEKAKDKADDVMQFAGSVADIGDSIIMAKDKLDKLTKQAVPNPMVIIDLVNEALGFQKKFETVIADGKKAFQ